MFVVIFVSMVALLSLSVSAWLPPVCQFARHFSINQLIPDSNLSSCLLADDQCNQSTSRYLDDFLMSVSYWEGQLIQPSVCGPVPPGLSVNQSILSTLSTKTFVHPINQLPDLSAERRFKLSALRSSSQSVVEAQGWINQSPTHVDESRFVGYDPRYGLTLDGHRLSVQIGTILKDGQHSFTAASKESLHLSMLARSLSGDRYAQRFIAPFDSNSDMLNVDGMNKAISETIHQLRMKINTYDEFNLLYPGYGSFLPWVSVNKSGVYPIHQVVQSQPSSIPNHSADPYIKHTVPSLDNGEWIWSLIAVIQALKSRFPDVKHQPMTMTHQLIDLSINQSKPFSIEQLRHSSTLLSTRYEALIDRLTSSMMTVFYTGDGRFRTVTGVFDIHGPVEPSNYYDGSHALNQSTNQSDGQTPHDHPSNQSFKNSTVQPDSLNDPYEGELFTDFAFLFGDWNATNDSRDSVWKFKRDVLQPATLTIRQSINESTADKATAITRYTVQKGWWFSAHEQWKYLMLPYTDSSTNNRVFINGEKARTAFSNHPSINPSMDQAFDFSAEQPFVHPIPGLYASTSGLASSDDVDTGYLSACGIDQIAYQRVTNIDVLTPYGSISLMLANRTIGLAWYLTHLQSTRAQTCYGASEALNRTGTQWSPLKTWDTSITVFLGMLGGIRDLTKQYLIEKGKYDELIDVIEFEWSRKFSVIEGEDEAWQLPVAQIPQGQMEGLPSCLADSYVCQCE